MLLLLLRLGRTMALEGAVSVEACHCRKKSVSPHPNYFFHSRFLNCQSQKTTSG